MYGLTEERWKEGRRNLGECKCGMILKSKKAQN